MGDGFFFEKLLLFFQLTNHKRIDILEKHSFILGNVDCKATVARYRLQHRQIVLLRKLVIVRPECRRDMDNAGAFFGRYKITGGNIPARFFRMRPRKERLVLQAGKKTALERIEKNQRVIFTHLFFKHLKT